MMTREQARSLVEQLVEAVNAHDTARLLSFYASDAITVSPVSGEIVGIAAIEQWWNTIFSLFTDWTVALTDVLTDRDRIVFFGTAAATDHSGWFGQPATGERFEYRAIVALTMAQGKIVRDERMYDLSGVLERFEKARLDKEMKTAVEVQRALLSPVDRSLAFCEVVADSVPCRAVGGDFVESIEFPSGDLGMVLGDVAGKGPSAAILAAMIQGMLLAQPHDEFRPSVILRRLNHLLASRHLEPRFATVVCGVLAPNGQFAYCNAGHNPPILLTSNKVERLVEGGPVLGLFGESTFEEKTLSLLDGDTLIMFSDGLTEARNSNDEEFGEDRLIHSAVARRNGPVKDLVAGILATVHDFCKGAPQTDDIAIMVMRFRPRQP